MTKSKLSKDQVKHVAELAQLELSEKGVKKFQKQLSEILDYVDQLDELDTKNVQPTSQVTGLENVTRQDEVSPSLAQPEALSGTKKKVGGYFQTKSVF